MKLNDYRSHLDDSTEYIKAKRELKLHFALADIVLKARTKRGWTQKELAIAVGTKQANISRLESGLANPTLEFIARLAVVLDFCLDFSFESPTTIQFDKQKKHESLLNNYAGTESALHACFE